MNIQPGFAPSSDFPQASREFFAAKRQEKNWQLFTGQRQPPADWIAVQLDDTERRIAVLIGKERHKRSVRDGREDKFKHNCPDPEKVDILGACGEAAFAKATGRYWGMGIDTFQSGDVGDYEVRTRTDVTYDLKVRKDEQDGRRVVQVYGCIDFRDLGGFDLDAEQEDAPELFAPVKPVSKRTGLPLYDPAPELQPLPCFRFFIAGYVLSDNVKKPEYESDKPGFEDVYLIPQADLRPPSLLIVRDWIRHYDLERKAPAPAFQSYNEYTGGEYYPPKTPETPVQLTEDALQVPVHEKAAKLSKDSEALIKAQQKEELFAGWNE